MTAGTKPCLWLQSRGKLRSAVHSYGRGGFETVELDGIEPSAGQHVKARPAPPSDSPTKTIGQRFPVTRWIRWPFLILSI